MKYLFVRPESKPKNSVGRGATVVLFNSAKQAAYYLLRSLLDTYGYTADRFEINLVNNEDDVGELSIVTFNDHDYYRWLDVINNKVNFITLEQAELLEGKEVANVVGGTRYDRLAIDEVGYKDQVGSLVSLIEIKLIKYTEPSLEQVDEPMPSFEKLCVPLTELVEYGDEYDLPVPNVSPSGFLGRLFKFLGGLVAVDGGYTNRKRKPVVVFESYLGGHIAIYRSLHTNNEVDVAFFNQHGFLVNVFSFQDGCPHRNGINGLTIEDLISIGTWRILHVNAFIAADENIKAVYHLTEAMDQLKIRGQLRHAAADQDEG